MFYLGLGWVHPIQNRLLRQGRESNKIHLYRGFFDYESAPDSAAPPTAVRAMARRLPAEAIPMDYPKIARISISVPPSRPPANTLFQEG